MGKINLDKYYTNTDVAKQCIDTTLKVVGKHNITHIIEPSAGNGSFSLQIECDSYDIEPDHFSIIKQDYLTSTLEYKKGRLIIGNPPFGERMNLAQQFFKKSIEIADYIAFILPISQLSNTNSLFEFDLISSIDLGKIKYSDRILHCCFNIYRRPKNGLNKKPNTKIEGIKIIRQDSKIYKTIKDFDIRMCYWGNGSAGKILKDDEGYSAEYKILINHDKKSEIIQVLKNTNWFEELECVSMLKIQQFHILNLIKKKLNI